MTSIQILSVLAIACGIAYAIYQTRKGPLQRLHEERERIERKIRSLQLDRDHRELQLEIIDPVSGRGKMYSRSQSEGNANDDWVGDSARGIRTPDSNRWTR